MSNGAHNDAQPNCPVPASPRQVEDQDDASVESSVEKPSSEETAGVRKEPAPPSPPLPHPQAEPPSPTAFGRYQVRRLLGRGGYGTVYLGFDSQLNREIAIKVPNLRLTSDKAEQQFLREARQLAQLKHPGIVTVFDVGIEQGRCYIISAYLAGQTLQAWLKTNHPTWEEAARIVAAL